MSNLRAQAERFKQKETARLEKAQHEARRLGIVRRHRETNVRTLRDILQNYPCPVSRPDEAAEEATIALLEVAAGFSSDKSAADAVKMYQTEVGKARARRISARDTRENQLLADIAGAVSINQELVEITDGGDGQKVPTLPDMPKPWCDVMAKALAEETTDAAKLFEGLEPGDAQLLRQGIEGAQALSAEKLKEAYVNMVRTAEEMLRVNRLERAEEVKDGLPPEPAAPDSLYGSAEKLAEDLAFAEGVLSSLVADATTPPDEQEGLAAAQKRIAALVATLKREVAGADAVSQEIPKEQAATKETPKEQAAVL